MKLAALADDHRQPDERDSKSLLEDSVGSNKVPCSIGDGTRPFIEILVYCTEEFSGGKGWWIVDR